MPYHDFTFPAVMEHLGLAFETGARLPDIDPIVPTAEFRDQLNAGVILAHGSDNEKARSEFIVAPVLLELYRLNQKRHMIFSGFDLNVDSAAGLEGPCEFLVTRSPRMSILTAPIVVVASVRNDETLDKMGRCIAAMRAAWLFNEAKGSPVSQVFGVSTTGSNWRFLRLQDTYLTVYSGLYTIPDIGRILGILQYMVETA
jgi:hypothetical protein